MHLTEAPFFVFHALRECLNRAADVLSIRFCRSVRVYGSCQMAEAEECPGSIRLYEKISRKGILLDKM